MKGSRLSKIAVAAMAAWSAAAMAQTQFVNRLMPQPAELSVNSGELALNSTFAVETPKVSDARLNDAIARAVRRIEMTAKLRHAGTGVTAETKLIVKVDRPGDAAAVWHACALAAQPFM